MRPSDYDEFCAMMQVVANYYGRALSADMLSLYWHGLRDLELEEVRHALNMCVQSPDTGQYMPKIADIRRMLSGTSEDVAMVAWSKVDWAMRHVGTYADVVFPDPLIHRVVHDMGGWIYLGTKSDEDWPFVAREFSMRYRAYRSRGEIPEYPRVLTGIANSYNASHGFPLEQPRMIGDQDKCAAVMSGGSNQVLGMSTAIARGRELTVVKL